MSQLVANVLDRSCSAKTSGNCDCFDVGRSDFIAGLEVGRDDIDVDTLPEGVKCGFDPVVVGDEGGRNNRHATRQNDNLQACRASDCVASRRELAN